VFLEGCLNQQKTLRLMGVFTYGVRSGMGTETTSATYRRAQNP